MRWITEEKVFASVLSRAHRGIDNEACIDSRKGNRLIFDSTDLLTDVFLYLLQGLMRLSGDEIAYYIVLNPDPVQYFVKEFKRYPLLEIQVADSCEAYLAALNEDPGGSPADAVGINWAEYALFPSSMKWFVWGLRDNDNGQLWIPLEWTEAVMDLYPYARPSEETEQP